MGVMRRELSAEGCIHIQFRFKKSIYKSQQDERTVHSPCDFTSLLVAPADRSKVSLVVHEPTVEEWLLVWVRGLNVDLRQTQFKYVTPMETRVN